MPKTLTTQAQIASLIDPHFVELLDRCFPAKPIHPSIPMDQILYDAGCRRVVDFLTECLAQSSPLSDD